MKYVISLIIAVNCTFVTVKAQDTLVCKCADRYSESINPSQEFIEMDATLSKTKGEVADVASGLTSLKNLKINDAYRGNNAINTLRNDAIKICAEIYNKLDTSSNSEIRRKINAKDTLSAENFEKYKSVLACYALKKFLNDYNIAAIKVFKDKKQSGEGNKGINWWPFAFFIVLIAGVSACVYLFWELKASRKKLDVYVQNFGDQMRKQSEEIADLKTALTKESTPPILSNKPEQREERPYQPAVQQTPSPAPLKRIYMRPPNGNLFSRESDSMRVYETYYMIDINPDGKTGTLRLVDDTATMEHAFSMIDVLRNACDLNGNNQPSSASQARQTPGEVEMTSDGYWKIKEKISLSW